MPLNPVLILYELNQVVIGNGAYAMTTQLTPG